jgi:hypothetical protein
LNCSFKLFQELADVEGFCEIFSDGFLNPSFVCFGSEIQNYQCHFLHTCSVPLYQLVLPDDSNLKSFVIVSQCFTGNLYDVLHRKETVHRWTVTEKLITILGIAFAQYSLEPLIPVIVSDRPSLSLQEL